MTTTRNSRSIGYDSLEQEVFLNLWRAYDRLRALEDELFARFELTAQQYNVLRLLSAEYPDALPTLQIAARLVSRAPDITRMLDKLEQRGWIERERLDGDRRTVFVTITRAGRALVAKIAEPLAETHKRQLGHMNAEDLKRLSALLREARKPHEADAGSWS